MCLWKNLYVTEEMSGKHSPTHVFHEAGQSYWGVWAVPWTRAFCFQPKLFGLRKKKSWTMSLLVSSLFTPLHFPTLSLSHIPSQPFSLFFLCPFLSLPLPLFQVPSLAPNILPFKINLSCSMADSSGRPLDLGPLKCFLLPHYVAAILSSTSMVAVVLYWSEVPSACIGFRVEAKKFHVRYRSLKMKTLFFWAFRASLGSELRSRRLYNIFIE